MIIGIDFDNTIIQYDNVFFDVALKLNFIQPHCPKNKFSIREQVRQLNDGEIKWRKLQALVYGEHISSAYLAPGFIDFIGYCRKLNIKVYIISHKTKFAYLDETAIDLHKSAILWLTKKHFFNRLGFKMSDIFFLETRKEKIEKIKDLKCNLFIDDLPEVFLEPNFPIDVKKILYNPHKLSYNYELSDIIEITNWIHAKTII